MTVVAPLDADVFFFLSYGDDYFFITLFKLQQRGKYKSDEVEVRE